MDLFGPMRTASFGGRNFIFVMGDDFSRFTWVLLLAHKSEEYDFFSSFCKCVQTKCAHAIVKIRSDHDDEFEKKNFGLFCNDHGIEHTFSTPRTQQQNDVIEQKNHIIHEVVRI